MTEPAGGEDDWVKQMLAEAMLGGSPLPSSEGALPVDEAEESPPGEPEVRYQVALNEPAVDVPSALEPTAVDVPTTVEPTVVEPTEPSPAVVGESDDGVVEQPAPASTSRLFDRPTFDATNDPDVDAMIEHETSESTTFEISEERTRMRGALEWLAVLSSAVIVALLLRAFLFQAFFIPSESMEETLRVDDRVLVNKLSYRFGDVERGEVVVFRRPDDQPGEFRDLIKRVIGLPGESIEARDNTIFIDGQVLIEPYITPGEVIGDFGPIVIPEGEYFMMGDNRDNSGDSRLFGTVSGDRFIGRAFFLFWPFDRIGSL